MSVSDGMKIVAKHSFLRALLLGFALFVAACSGGDDAVATEAAGTTGDESAEAASADAGDGDDESGEADTTDDAMADEGDAAVDESEAMADDDSAADDPDDGGETPTPAAGPPPSLPPDEARAAAEQNIPNLQTSDDVRDIEVVSVYDGSITSLREVVTGDRPVLVWFWAPH